MARKDTRSLLSCVYQMAKGSPGVRVAGQPGGVGPDAAGECGKGLLQPSGEYEQPPQPRRGEVCEQRWAGVQRVCGCHAVELGWTLEATGSHGKG